ncbi:ABC transporter-like protein [Thermoclostridium stercorarium subsp. stercorarium DSM 8532]|uniref:ABC transporter-like protein n=3 Tax=Thermoclostridium stercorarium TaxID=1510 RepID=L7VIH0_THES1|nr:ABC transporter ATP-binding protein [Thermoclostridium stercorarium]AGC67855.1 ABC transporter-like protein [Thermoclostridium stercorarium subsp. stercorarium DSM 8532]AGI38896.1 ABC transporter ATPase subunit [Thermoclostridium stercorarium subsp. stercorarium DSM 8532]ANW98267.1 nitrate ABC transporter ATP-binding protein [Thermoclostridium stercorarium subsp. thermolacticum DSM 2910]ANX00791.1 nitrate ABC transporter ATP-binding protein [Thermoclostridium stercorarium subsp. leptospartum
MEPAVEIINLSKSYILNNKELKALENVNLSAENGKFISIIGPSGCGKSTLFRIIAGLEKDFTGSVFVNGCDVKVTRPYIAYMLQKDLLLPWRNVRQNILLPLELDGSLKNTDTGFVQKMLSEFGLEDFADAYPDELSGGMRQRVAFLRTWLMKGSVMLLDEPFGALDALTRNRMQDWLLNIWEKHRKTVLFITHDIEEAVYLSDEVYVMGPRPGRIIDRLNIELERPRKRDIIYTPVFIEYKKYLMKSLTI